MYTVDNPSEARIMGTNTGNTELVFSDRWKTGLKEFNQYLINYKKIQRKKEKARTVLFNAIGLCISLSLVILAFEWKSYDQNDLVNLGTMNAEFEELQDIPITEQPPPPPPQSQPVTIIEVSDIEEIKEDIQINLDVEVTQESVLEDVIYEAVEVEEEEVEEVFLFVEEAPHPVGGLKSFYNYLAEQLEYPVVARRLGIEGKVYVQFIINKDGSITDLEILKGIGSGCDQEALRVLRESPNWVPGKQRGQPVKVKMAMPIIFDLQ